jgi:hypothetical protein
MGLPQRIGLLLGLFNIRAAIKCGNPIPVLLTGTIYVMKAAQRRPTAFLKIPIRWNSMSKHAPRPPNIDIEPAGQSGSLAGGALAGGAHESLSPGPVRAASLTGPGCDTRWAAPAEWHAMYNRRGCNGPPHYPLAGGASELAPPRGEASGLLNRFSSR